MCLLQNSSSRSLIDFAVARDCHHELANVHLGVITALFDGIALALLFSYVLELLNQVSPLHTKSIASLNIKVKSS